MGNLVSRREFLKFTGGVAAGAAALPTNAEAAAAGADAGSTVLPYKAKAVGKAGGMAGQSGRGIHVSRCIVAVRAGEDGHAGSRRRRPQPGHRRLQHACARTWDVRSATTPASGSSSAPATSACSTPRKADRWSAARRRKTCRASC